MNVGEKLKSAVEDAARHAGIEATSKDHSVKTAKKPEAKEAHASFAHVDYSKLALLKPTLPIASATVKAAHAASVTMKDPSVKKDLANVKAAVAPLVTSGGAVLGDAVDAAAASVAVVNGAEAMAAALGTGQAELTPIGAVTFAIGEAKSIKSHIALHKDLRTAIHDARVAAPAVREAAHHVTEIFKKNTGR